MSRRRQELALARARLQQRSTVLRERVVAQAQAMQPALAIAQQAQDAARWLRAHPGLVAGAVAALVVLRPRRVLRWALRAWSSWQLLSQARAWLDRFQRGH